MYTTSKRLLHRRKEVTFGQFIDYKLYINTRCAILKWMFYNQYRLKLSHT